MDEIGTALTNSKRPVILGVSETWLDSSVLDGKANVPSYTLFRRDRDGRGGGVLVYVPVDIDTILRTIQQKLSGLNFV